LERCFDIEMRIQRQSMPKLTSRRSRISAYCFRAVTVVA
jgi:hypothetical protein